MKAEIADVIKEIVHCPRIIDHFNGKYNDCSEIIKTQNKVKKEDFQVPEPFNGEIDNAKVLVISSNPSIDDTENEVYPTYNDDNDEYIIGYFYNRFDKYIQDGSKTYQKDKSFSKSVRFLASIKARVNEALELFTKNKAIPGKDYCLTEFVHCKSKKEIGVNHAITYCSKYMKKIIKISSAKVLFIFGSPAMRNFCTLYNLDQNKNLIGPIKIENIDRMICFLPHPNERGSLKSINDNLNDDELEILKNWLIEVYNE